MTMMRGLWVWLRHPILAWLAAWALHLDLKGMSMDEKLRRSRQIHAAAQRYAEKLIQEEER